MAGSGKRLPEVPPAADALGGIVSKATLLEVAYHLALRIQGEEDEHQAIHILVTEIELLTRKKVSVPSKWKSSYADQLRALLLDREEST